MDVENRRCLSLCCPVVDVHALYTMTYMDFFYEWFHFRVATVEGGITRFQAQDIVFAVLALFHI